MEQKIILSSFEKFIRAYTDMNIFQKQYHCPYWVNKIKAGMVIVRGFENGKGEAASIRMELVKKFREEKLEKGADIIPLARRNRIGIDCSGFVYRALEKYVKQVTNEESFDLTKIFLGGVNRTNARTLTDTSYVYPSGEVADIRQGDLIRLRGGKHVAIITNVASSQIRYAHSSHLTKVFGVHEDVIYILDSKKTIEFQDWAEKTREEKNYRDESFFQNDGDGVFRLKMLQNYD